jgi:hypothetical protein
MTVVLVAPPVSSAQRALYTPEIEAVFWEYVRQLGKTYQCRFIDYRARLGDDLFSDNHHVLPPGGKTFTRVLTREVLVPCWREVLRERRNVAVDAPNESLPGQASAKR